MKLGLNETFYVMWIPDSSKTYSGEVKDKTIYIYEECADAAIRTLKHEVIDYCISSRLVQPLIRLVNLLIKSRADEIYQEKEKLVEDLLKLME